jgi:hypothetical protein
MAGIPTVVVTTTGFSALAVFTGKAGGIQNLPVAEYPGPLGIHGTAAIERNVTESLIDKVVDGLTRAGGTSSGAHSAAHDARSIVCSGTLDQVARYFVEQEWSDGLPIVPPTVERIERFLDYTDFGPDQQIAVLPSANLIATPWTIAANAVMAGCRGEHMPLLIAAVQALGDERCSLNNIGSSSGIFPYLLIGGPIANELAIEFGPQLVNRGPNPALGRALGLIVRNIAGFRPGASYMGTFGYPLAVAFAESNNSPWPPFHVDQGFDRDANTVTIGVTNNWGPAPSPYDRPDKPGAQTALELLCKEITKKTRLYHFPDRGPNAEKVMITLLISPSVAKSLAHAGYSKEGVKRYIHQHATISLKDFDWALKYTAIVRTSAHEQVDAGVLPPEFAGSPDDLVRVLSGPDIVHIIVCGDPHRNRVMVMEGGHTQPTTKEIRLPVHWNALLRDVGRR